MPGFGRKKTTTFNSCCEFQYGYIIELPNTIKNVVQIYSGIVQMEDCSMKSLCTQKR